MSQHEEQPTTPAVPETARVGMVPVADGLQMKHRHPVAAWLGLPLVTLGIYHLVWYYKIHKEMAMFDRRRVVPVVGPMVILLLLGWTVVAPLVSYFGAGKRIRAAQRAAGLPETCSPGVGLLLMLLGGAGVIYYQVQLNKVTDSYQGAAVGDQVALYV